VLDYFSNHRLKLRFPWRLYHGPIVEALQRVVSDRQGSEILNLGSGPFFELERLELSGQRFTLCDIDPRAIELAKQRYGTRIAGADVVGADGKLPYEDGRFDVLVSMDVIEHVIEPLPWLREALRVIKPGGVLFLTTPNYGSKSLRLIENTALELIARLQHFSRKDLHPTKMDAARLYGVMSDAGVGSPSIEPIAFNWVLSAHGRKA
jgi:2-polyprenyl-3-methyl-5-hydroxy-6-metoxy-1,4-benzoquinol methylase